MFHVKNCHSGFTGHVNEAIVHAAIARELGPEQVEPTIEEMKHDDVKFGDGRGNVYWHEWSAAELRFASALFHSRLLNACLRARSAS